MRHPPAAINISDLSLSRGGQPLVSGLGLSLQNGDVLWLTGPNGVGKTTILLALAGLLSPDDGTVKWVRDGTDCRAADLVGYSAHSGPERAGLSLGEELGFWQAAYRDTVSISERLASVGLSGRERTPVEGLSAGQRRRLGLARLMAEDKAVWLMDEPLAGLDAQGRALVERSIADHAKRGGISVIASHHPVTLPDVSARKLVLRA